MENLNKETANTIRLQDGRTIQGYPKANIITEETKEVPVFDTTGVYFRIGKKPIKSQPSTIEEDMLEKLFTDNIFLILANRKRILNDSRMLLTPVAVRNGLAYSGEFQIATLGVYLEWWLNAPYSVLFDEDDTMSLIWFLSGSPLSGCNHCLKVYEDGSTKEAGVTFFDKLWPKFADILADYHEPKKRFEAYSLPEVIDILKQETKTEDYIKSIEDFHKQAKTALLDAQLHHLEEKYKILKEKCDYYQDHWHSSLIQSRFEKVREFYNRYIEKEKQFNLEKTNLEKEGDDLNKKFEKGELTHKQYRKMLNKNNNAVDDLWGDLIGFKNQELSALFPEITTLSFKKIEVIHTEMNILDKIIELFKAE